MGSFAPCSRFFPSIALIGVLMQGLNAALGAFANQHPGGCAVLEIVTFDALDNIHPVIALRANGVRQSKPLKGSHNC